MGCRTEPAAVHIAHVLQRLDFFQFFNFFYNLHDLPQKKNLHDLPQKLKNSIFFYNSHDLQQKKNCTHLQQKKNYTTIRFFGTRLTFFTHPPTHPLLHVDPREVICAACCFYGGPRISPLPKRANPWVQGLFEAPWVLPYPAPGKVKTYKMALWEQAPPNLGSPCWVVDFPYPCPNSTGKL